LNHQKVQIFSGALKYGGKPKYGGAPKWYDDANPNLVRFGSW
jgi:hypothetical protein